LETAAAFEVSCCAVIGWLHVEHSEGAGFVHLTYQHNGATKTLSASEKHIAYVYRGPVQETTIIAFNASTLQTVMFKELVEGDQLAVFEGDHSRLSLTTIEKIEHGAGMGAYVALLEDGGLPLTEGALMSMSSVVTLPGPVMETARKLQRG
jgi:hypothetical protein